ncbi:SusC/RagA family TonB-linked outer membrane protein [Niabella terrae]
MAQHTVVNIRAQIKDDKGLPIAGVLVQHLGEQGSSTVSDKEGWFELEADTDSELIISADNYKTTYLNVSSSITEIILQPNGNEAVQVAFRSVAMEDLLGGVSSVRVSDIIHKNYSQYSLDNMEIFVPGYNGTNWAMGEALTMVDGVPRDANNVMPTEIEEISFLKSASAIALYGSRAAKGVINIITKRGRAGKHQVDIQVNSGIHAAKSFPRYLGSAEYMTLYNEARRNDGLTDLYSEETIYLHAAGTNPYRYPNVDYYSETYLKKAFTRFDATAEISGGNDKARYYTNINYYTGGSFLDFGQAKNNDRNGRFSVRGNIDINLGRYITSSVDASATFYTGKGVNTDYWGAAATMRPHRFTPLLPLSMIEPDDDASQLLLSNSNHIIEGKYLLGGSQLDPTNAIAAVYAGGYNQYVSRQFQFNTGMGADLRNVLKGLKFQTNFAVDYATAYSLSYNNTFATYAPVWNSYSGKDLISSLTKYGQDATSGTQSISGNWYRQTIALSGFFSYDNTFNSKHHVSGLLLANGFLRSEAQLYHKVGNANLGLQLGYDYLQKYYIDFTGAMVHSARLPEGNRNALSPTVSIGWRISKERFLENSSFIDDLKLFASAGILHTDLDIPEYYMYQGYYTTTGAWYGWKDGTGIQATESRRGNNPNMKFPKREEISFGFEGSFFNHLLTLNAGFFTDKITGNIVQSSVLYPSYFSTGWPESSFIPFVNYNNDKRTGGEFGIVLKKRTGQVDWQLGINGTYYTTKATRRAEVYEDDYQYRKDKVLDGIWGLENLGFFKDLAEIENAPRQTFGQVKPGDIRYKDQNADGIIDQRDEIYLGKGGWFGAPFTTGAHLTATWKRFSFFMMGVLRSGAYGMKNNSFFWVDGEDKYSEIVRNRWTETTKATATYPRLTTTSADNNFRASDFWMYSTKRFDLARIQLSYDFNQLLQSGSFLRGLGVYINGSNLVTLGPNRDILELSIGSAPQTRFYSIGIKASF